MGSDWEEKNLEDIAEVIDSRHKTPIYSEHGYPMVRVVDVKGGPLRLQGTKKVSEEVYTDFSKGRHPSVGDLIISRVGSYGVVSYVDSNEQFCLGQNTAFIIPQINSRFLYYQLNSPSLKWQMDQFVVGAVQKTISLKSIRQFKISVPSKDTQKAIAHILGSLDDKIELNRQMNETLEAMAQALFKSWFVDFDPVIDNALAAGNPIPDALKAKAEQRQQLRDAEAGQNKAPASAHHAHFPNAFEFHDDMGWIPKGWEVSTVAEVTSVIIDHRGKTPKKLGGDWSESGYPAISAKNIKNNKLVRHDTIRFVDKEIYEKWMKIPLEKGDVAMTSEAPLGELYYFNSKIDYLLSQRLYGLRADKSKSSGSFLFHWLQSNIGASDLQNRATGTTVTGIRQSELRKVVVLCPSSAVLNKFDEFANVYLEKSDSNENSNLNLAKLRDTLLPKLLSGELRIPDAEKLITEAGVHE